MYNISEIKSAVCNAANVLSISKVILVGSYAKDEATEQSDIDLVIEGNDLSETYWEFLFKMEDAFSTKVDLLTMRGLEHSCIRENILSGGIVLYEK